MTNTTRFFQCVMIALIITLAVSVNAASDKTKKNVRPEFQPSVDTPGLPRVLLIGDSISIGYTLPTRRLLDGKANVHRIPANGGPTTRGLASIDRWLGDGKWDVIHFNWGIHDLRHMEDGKRQVEPADYEKNLRTLVAKLKETNAVLIWASITPIPKGKLNPDRTFGDETEYNQIAARVMQECGIPINDLHTCIMPRFDKLHKPHDLHYLPEGYQFLAVQVAAEIEKAIERSNRQTPAPTRKK